MEEVIEEETIKDVKNNSKTKKLAEKFVSTEELLNQNKEIEDKITSTELINFYFQALENSNALLEKNEMTEKNFQRILKIMEDFKVEVEKLSEVTKTHKKSNEDRKTIDAYKESYDNLNRFVKKLISRLNQVTIIPKNVNSSEISLSSNNTNKKNNSNIVLYLWLLAFGIIGLSIFIFNH